MRFNVHDRDYCVVKARVLLAHIQSDANQLENLVDLSLQGCDRSIRNKAVYAMELVQKNLGALSAYYRDAIDSIEREYAAYPTPPAASEDPDGPEPVAYDYEDPEDLEDTWEGEEAVR